MPLMTPSVRKQMMFQAWKNHCDLMSKEVAETKLAEYESDPRYEKMKEDINKMRKAELVEKARKELGLSLTYLNSLHVPILREKLRKHRKQNQEIENPMKKLPKGFSSMRKPELIEEAKRRGIILDQINPNKTDWKQLLNRELQLAIHDHVEYSKGMLTEESLKAIPSSKTMMFSQKTSMSDNSSEELQEICAETVRQEQSSSSTSRRKRNM